MTPAALIMMLTTIVVVTFATVYFFIKVLKAPEKPEPDSYYENNEPPL
jgi:heme/copper-type cytochrome/quinol oxidase subunit 2